MKWIIEFWRSFCELSVTGGDFWLITPYQSFEDKYPGASVYLGVPKNVLKEITNQALMGDSYIKLARGGFSGHMLGVSDSESSLARGKVIPLSKTEVLHLIPGVFELTLHPSFVSLNVQFSEPYYSFRLREDCLQILLKKKFKNKKKDKIDLSLSVAVTFNEYYLADYQAFILLSREQVKKLLQLSKAKLCRDLFALFGQEQISDTPGKNDTSFGFVTTDLINKMEEFANSR